MRPHMRRMSYAAHVVCGNICGFRRMSYAATYAWALFGFAVEVVALRLAPHRRSRPCACQMVIAGLQDDRPGCGARIAGGLGPPPFPGKVRVLRWRPIQDDVAVATHRAVCRSDRGQIHLAQTPISHKEVSRKGRRAGEFILRKELLRAGNSSCAKNSSRAKNS